MLEGWKFGVGESLPEEFDVAGNPYWVIVRGNLVNDTHTDRKGRGLVLQCLHLYATPAVASWRSFVKPEPYSWYGSLSWPERATYCKPAEAQQVENEQPDIAGLVGNVPQNAPVASPNNATA